MQKPFFKGHMFVKSSKRHSHQRATSLNYPRPREVELSTHREDHKNTLMRELSISSYKEPLLLNINFYYIYIYYFINIFTLVNLFSPQAAELLHHNDFKPQSSCMRPNLVVLQVGHAHRLILLCKFNGTPLRPSAPSG